MSPARGEVWARLGAPDDQIGSVNEPRVTEEFGARWNEKWVYLGADGRTPERVVLWLRYDLVGAFRLDAEGTAEPEPLD